MIFGNTYRLHEAVLEGWKTQMREPVPLAWCVSHNLAEIRERCPCSIGEKVELLRDYDELMDVANGKSVNTPCMRITNIRVERLQDISQEDCIKEGISRCEKEWGYWVEHKNGCLDFYVCDTPKEAFAERINKIYEKDLWAQNPFVFVYDFVVEKKVW